MKKIFLWGTVLVVFSLAIVFLIKPTVRQEPNSQSGKLTVVTTLFPLYDMAKSIGGDNAEVSQLLPPGVEAHSFEPKPSDIIKINEADIFIYTGEFMEPWVDDILKSVTNKNLIIVDASKDTKMIEGISHHHEEEDIDAHDEEEDEHDSSMDPHIWLDFDNAKTMVENIEQAFIAKDSDHEHLYEQRTTDYNQTLSEIDKTYRTTLSNCKSTRIVYGGHYAFGYMAHRYDLNYSAAQGVSPDAEPTASDLASLIDQINTEKITHIFYEELTSPKIAETIAQETKADMLLLNAGHNLTKDQFESGTSFFDILNSNLNNLKTGLECR